MKNFSNKYIFLYSAILVAVVAVLLSVVAMSLKSRQEHNKLVEKEQMILRAVGMNPTADETEAIYQENIQEINLMDNAELPAYYYTAEEQTIIYVRGTGLWGPIWGYIAFDKQGTVTGAVFDHEGETPGLGGEVATEEFASRFAGKSILDESLSAFEPIVLKKHADPASLHEVDAISGGTMTSNGVSAMLGDCLEKYAAYFIANNTEAEPVMDTLMVGDTITNLETEEVTHE